MLRLLSVIVLLLTITAGLPLSTAAQATPDSAAANPFADLGLAQLDITATDTSFDGLPSELDAGRYVVGFTNASTSEFQVGGAFMQVPEGMTTDELIAMAAAPAATPVSDVASPVASPVAEGPGDEIPPWYYETQIAGGPYADPGDTTYAVVDLQAGDWVFWAEYPGAPQAPVGITVSGELPADLPVPQADVAIEMSDFAFSFSEPLAAGPQIIELANVGDQPHFIGFGTVPAGATVDEVLAAFEGMFSDPAASPMATPEGSLTFDDIEEGWGSGDQSGGVTAWYAIDLEPGTHVVVCFVTDPETGLPHVMLGMIEVIDVE